MVSHSPEAMGFADHVYAVKNQSLVPQTSGLDVLK
jgi:hypothetical protein